VSGTEDEDEFWFTVLVFPPVAIIVRTAYREKNVVLGEIHQFGSQLGDDPVRFLLEICRTDVEVTRWSGESELGRPGGGRDPSYAVSR